MTDNDKAIEALRARAEGMPTGYLDDKHVFQYDGLNYCISGNAWKLIFSGDEETVDKEPSGLDVAATLLSALDPDAVVVDDIGGTNGECWGCHLSDSTGHDGDNVVWCTVGLGEGEDGSHNERPGPRCPGPAQPGKKWVLVEVPE